MDLNSLPDVLTPAEVAAVMRCDPKTVTRWAKSGKLAFFRTPGGHRRFLRADVEAFTKPPEDSWHAEPR